MANPSNPEPIQQTILSSPFSALGGLTDNQQPITLCPITTTKK